MLSSVEIRIKTKDIFYIILSMKNEDIKNLVSVVSRLGFQEKE